MQELFPSIDCEPIPPMAGSSSDGKKYMPRDKKA